MSLPSLVGSSELISLSQSLAHFSAVVLLRVNDDGLLVDVNRGGQVLLRLAGKDPDQAPDVRDFFVHPGFDELSAVHAQTGHSVFEGVINLGDATSHCRSLLGRVYRLERELLVVAEYNVEDMELLNANVIDLNEQLGATQRDLARSNRKLRDSEARLTGLSLSDPLTGVANRRSLTVFLDHEVERFRRYQEPLSVIMTDIDFFKQINDDFGHGWGDKLLVAFAALLRDQLRTVDHVARFGGEEFVLVLPHTTLQEALAKTEILRAAVQALCVDGLPRGVTASFGVAQIEAADDAHRLLKRVDEAVYVSKRNGRNRITAAGPSPAADPSPESELGRLE